jgi:fermentation-respiration switch protein FrsA (DUF1100 family)
MFYFEPMDGSQVVEKPLKIPANGIELNAKVVFPRYVLDDQGLPREKLPAIIFNHGWGAPIDNPIMKQYTAAIALGGPFAVILFDCRGFGKSPGKPKLDEALFDDIPKVIDFTMGLAGIDPARVGFAGVSMGGEVALARAYPDSRIKAVVTLCALHNARENFTRKAKNLGERMQIGFLNASGVHGKLITEETNARLSPEFFLKQGDDSLNDRVMLVQSKDDRIISMDQFEKNRKALGSSPDNILLLERGGHIFIRQELLVLASVLRFFKAKL